MKTIEPSRNIIAQLLSRNDPIRWVFAGDSITHGALHTMGWRDYTELFSERVRWELGRMRDVLIKTGVSGWRVENLTADWEWSVSQHRPHVLSVALGTNDCASGAAGLDTFKNGLAGR
jgi:lysophospholipase L1-like esterase